MTEGDSLNRCEKARNKFFVYCGLVFLLQMNFSHRSNCRICDVTL